MDPEIKVKKTRGRPPLPDDVRKERRADNHQKWVEKNKKRTQTLALQYYYYKKYDKVTADRLMALRDIRSDYRERVTAV